MRYFIYIIFLLFLGCRTSKKIVEKSKVDIEKSELSIFKKDSLVNSDIKIYNNKLDSLIWSTYMKYFNFSYNGQDNNDELEFIKTDNGLKIKGKGIVKFIQKELKKDSVKISNSIENTQEKTKIDSNSSEKTKNSESNKQEDKKKNVKSLGLNFGMQLTALFSFLLIIYLIYRFFLKK